jgi:NTE family protein
VTKKTVGIALGGGGAKGLAHIPLLKVLDKLDVEVVAVAGTSIGAIIGALYASLGSGARVADALDAILHEPRSLQGALEAKRTFGWIELLGVSFGRSYVLEADGFMAELSDYLGAKSFEDLPIPMKVVAADFWKREEVVFDSGPLMPAIAASFCLPGIFKPVVIDGRALVDGGSVNPVPFDLIRDDCDIVIAVDVLGKRTPDADLIPSMTDAIFNTFQIAEKTIANIKLRTHKPDIYIEPAIENVKVLEFQKAEQIYEQVQPHCERLESELKKLLNGEG